MSDQNPYAVGDYAGVENSVGETDPNQHPLMRELIDLLSQTRPWVRLIGVLLMIGAVLMIGGGVIMIAMSIAGAGAGQWELLLMGPLYFVMSALYVYPALCLNRYAAAISKAETTSNMADVVYAIMHQKRFWRFSGIAAAVILVLYLLFFVFAILMAVAG